MSGFRAPTKPDLILPERRPDVIANAASTQTLPVRYADLTPGRRQLFELQLDAYRAAVHLVRAGDEAVMAGRTVHADLVAAWISARRAWHWMRGIE